MTGSIACLAGSQTNQDGRSASLTAPNGPAQEKCIKAVLRECKLTPTEVDCFECHGTGTFGKQSWNQKIRETLGLF